MFIFVGVRRCYLKKLCRSQCCSINQQFALEHKIGHRHNIANSLSIILSRCSRAFDFFSFFAMKNSKQKLNKRQNWKMPSLSEKENIVYCQLISRKTDFTGQTLKKNTHFLTH